LGARINQNIKGKKMAQLQDLFQTHAVVKILDFLTLYKEFEYTRTDIANETGISRRTLYQVWPILERFDLVRVTKSSGLIKFYKLNTENPISKHLVALADKISFFEADKIAGVESIPVLQANLPTYISSSQVQQSTRGPPVEVTIMKLTVKGTPSDVEELFQKISDLKDVELKIPILAYTGFETASTKKKRQQRNPSTLQSNGTPMVLVTAK